MKGKMITMIFVMIFASVSCFAGSIFFAQKEAKQEKLEKQQRESDYGIIFGDDLPGYKELKNSGSFSR